MNRPFVFGKAVEDVNFIGRERECERIRMNFSHGVNTLLMSPRRWGKTSIVRRIGSQVKSDDLQVVFLDIFACRDEYDFYNKLAEAVLRQTASRFDEWKALSADFLARLSPKISYSIDGGLNEYAVSLGISPKTHKPEEVLMLPQQIAQKKGCNILICIDEFQQVGEFPDSLSAQKKMRSIWQLQQNVSYCLYGSRKHMMEKLFLGRSKPFYNFAENIPLDVIPLDKWIPYIENGFASWGKTIHHEQIRQLCQTVEFQPSAIQQYAWITLINTKDEVSDEILRISLHDMIEENATYYLGQTEHLTSYQLNFLRAILAGIHEGFGNEAVRNEYRLGSYSNITRLKTMLVEKELIDITPKGAIIPDPVFRLWLKEKLL